MKVQRNRKICPSGLVVSKKIKQENIMISKLKRIFQSKKKELQEIYNLKNIFIESLIVFFVLALLDGFDIPSKSMGNIRML